MESIKLVLQGRGFSVAEATDEKSFSELKCKLFNESTGSLHEKDGYNCDICKNKGGTLVSQEEYGIYTEAYRPCKCMKTRAILVKLERSGLKNIIKDYSFDKYEATDEWQKHLKGMAQHFIADDKNTWFVMSGQSGSGKTHLCTAIAAHYLRQGKGVQYMVWTDDAPALKGKVTNGEEYDKAINEYKNAEVLYIDDLFKPAKDASGAVLPPTGADIRLAFEILNYRYNNKELITLISSERTIQDILSYDTALGGRISQMTVPYGYYLGIKNDPSRNYRVKGIVEI